MYHVYAIGKKKDLMPPYDQCYIGVTKRPQSRWNNHTKSKYLVGAVIRKYSLTFDENFVILYTGEDIECYLMETQMRPIPLIGLNLAAGGNGGDTRPYPPGRSVKISKAHLGRKCPWNWKSILSRGSYVGAKNPYASTWVLTDPDDNKYDVIGTFQEFCDERNLLGSSLRYHKGHPVPPLVNKKGGYRAKNEISLEKRINTIGWMCEKCSDTGGGL